MLKLVEYCRVLNLIDSCLYKGLVSAVSYAKSLKFIIPHS